jgi:hypothetical protein
MFDLAHHGPGAAEDFDKALVDHVAGAQFVPQRDWGMEERSTCAAAPAVEPNVMSTGTSAAPVQTKYLPKPPAPADDPTALRAMPLL